MIDEIFNYATSHQVCDLVSQTARLQENARCRVRISDHTVIATELPYNPGMSLTNAAATVAMQVCQFYEIPLAELVWIEHYPEEPQHTETFDRVYFTLKAGRLAVDHWQRLSVDEVHVLFSTLDF